MDWWLSWAVIQNRRTQISSMCMEKARAVYSSVCDWKWNVIWELNDSGKRDIHTSFQPNVKQLEIHRIRVCSHSVADAPLLFDQISNECAAPPYEKYAMFKMKLMIEFRYSFDFFHIYGWIFHGKQCCCFVCTKVDERFRLFIKMRFFLIRFV